MTGRAAPLRLGTRGSRLAVVQSEWAADRIRATTGRPVDLVPVRTTGDILDDRPLSEIGGQGLFTSELDQALLEGRIDLAVHSLKDLPTRLPDGIEIAAVPPREDVRDVLIGPRGVRTALLDLPAGARIGTSSLRRQALVLAARPDLRVLPLRGNLDTRIARVDGGELEAVILAAAGLRRMGWTDRISEALDPGGWLPAPGQAALAIAVRSDALAGARTWAAKLDDTATRAEVTAERTILRTLEAGCRLPVAALGIAFGRRLRLRSLVASPDGRRAIRAEATGDLSDPEALGRHVASILLDRGAASILGAVEAR